MTQNRPVESVMLLTEERRARYTQGMTTPPEHIEAIKAARHGLKEALRKSSVLTGTPCSEAQFHLGQIDAYLDVLGKLLPEQTRESLLTTAIVNA